MKFKEWCRLDEGFRYGNYCGPGPYLDKKTCRTMADGSPPPKPINAVDASCRQHDIDYCKCQAGSMSGVVGFGNDCTKAADQKMLGTLSQLMQSGQLDPNAARAAQTISKYFGVHNKVMDFRNWLGGMFSRKQQPQ